MVLFKSVKDKKTDKKNGKEQIDVMDFFKIKLDCVLNP